MKAVCFRKGQNLAELALIIGLVGLVFIGMEVYIKRGMQGKVKDLTDYMIGAQPKKASQIGEEVPRETPLSLNSTMTAKESIGGSRRLTESQNLTYRQ